MRHPDFEPYTLVDCQVVKHQHYGLVVRVVPDGQLGYVDESAISDQSYAAPADWPAEGEALSCVVLGGTRDGRLRLSCRPRDVALARAVPNIEAVLATWRQARDGQTEDVGRLLDIFERRDLVAVLRWALRKPGDSTDQSCASRIAAKAPDWLIKDLHEEC